jgi:AcrR family transcriptional regulator
MPSKTFLNLPSSKQNRIIEAAKKEFSEVAISEVSINKIIKGAGISRGSFYMYFQDKYDLLFYLLQEFKNQFSGKLQEIKKEANGELTDLMLSLHNVLYNTINDNVNRNFISNFVIYSFSESSKEKKHLQFWATPLEELKRSLLEAIDISSIDERFCGNLDLIVDTALVIMKNSLANAYVNRSSLDEAEDNYRKQLQIIQYGYKRKEESKC